MSELLDDQIAVVDRRGNVTSKQLRENFENIKNAHNSERTARLAMTTPPAGSEVTDARGGEDALDTRLAQHINAYGNKHITGFAVEEQDTPDLTVKISAGRAVVGGNVVNRGYNRTVTVSGSLATITDKAHGLSTADKVYVTVTGNGTYLALGEHTITKIDDDTFTVPSSAGSPSDFTCNFSRYSPTISKPSNPDSRYDVFVVNSAYEVERIVGVEGTAPTMPVLSETQVPIAFMKIAYNTTTITDAILTECIGQGVTDQDGNWSFTIQDAVDALPATGGTLTISEGQYHENVDLVGLSNIRLIGVNKPTLNLVQGETTAIQMINTVGTPQDNILISGLIINGGAVTGATSLIGIEYTNNVTITDIKSDGNVNSSSGAGYIIVNMDDCSNFYYVNNKAVYSAMIAIESSVTNYYVESNNDVRTDNTIDLKGAATVTRFTSTDDLTANARIIANDSLYVNIGNISVASSGTIKTTDGNIETTNGNMVSARDTETKTLTFSEDDTYNIKHKHFSTTLSLGSVNSNSVTTLIAPGNILHITGMAEDVFYNGTSLSTGIDDADMVLM